MTAGRPLPLLLDRGRPRSYTGKYEHRVLPGIGHNVPQEAPQAFAKAMVDVGAMGT